MNTTIRSPFSPSDAGCWLDGCFGDETNAFRVKQIARDYGFKPNLEGLNRGEHGVRLPDLDESDTSEEESFLNTLCPEGFWIGWQDGDFGLWEIEEENEC